jgi:hypothetical protein
MDEKDLRRLLRVQGPAPMSRADDVRPRPISAYVEHRLPAATRRRWSCTWPTAIAWSRSRVVRPPPPSRAGLPHGCCRARRISSRRKRPSGARPSCDGERWPPQRSLSSSCSIARCGHREWDPRSTCPGRLCRPQRPLLRLQPPPCPRPQQPRRPRPLGPHPPPGRRLRPRNPPSAARSGNRCGWSYSSRLTTPRFHPGKWSSAGRAFLPSPTTKSNWSPKTAPSFGSARWKPRAASRRSPPGGRQLTRLDQGSFVRRRPIQVQDGLVSDRGTAPL